MWRRVEWLPRTCSMRGTINASEPDYFADRDDFRLGHVVARALREVKCGASGRHGDASGFSRDHHHCGAGVLRSEGLTMIKEATALSHAQEIAEEVLIPHAEKVDATGHIPQGHLEVLAERGLFGIWAPAAVGGWNISHQEARRVYEILAGSCGSTYFAWWQHHAIVRKLAASANTELAARWLTRLASGQSRAGDM